MTGQQMQQPIEQQKPQANREAVQRKLAELRRKASSSLISELEDALHMARELQDMGLDEQILDNVKTLNSQANNEYSCLRHECDDIETTATLGCFREAISQLEDYIRRGAYEFYDGYDGMIRPSSQVLARYNREYWAFCTQKAKESLERAEKSLPTYPKAAVTLIETALKEFDRADPDLLDRLHQRILELNDHITRWDQAQALVKKAAYEPDPEKRLALLEVASVTYRGYEGIGELLVAALRDAAGAIIHDVRNIHDDARFHLNQGRLDEAQTIALRARERASQARGESTDLKVELARIDTLMADLAQAAAMPRLVAEVRSSVEVLLAKQDFASACEVLQGLPEAARQDHQIKIMEAVIARARGATTILNMAKRLYAGGDYTGVLDLLGLEGAEAEAAQSEERLQGLTREQQTELELLRKQAIGRQAYQEAVTLEHDDPDTAEMLLDLARWNNPEVEASVATRLVGIESARMVRWRVKLAADLAAAGQLLAGLPADLRDHSEIAAARTHIERAAATLERVA